jgi:hypothetical protein
MRYKFTLENLKIINKISLKIIDSNFINDIIKILKLINFEEVNQNLSYIEITNNAKQEHILFYLKSPNKLSLDIAVHKYGFDFFVNGNESVFEMYDIKKINIKYLEKWLSKYLVNKKKLKGDILIYNEYYDKHDKSDILMKKSSLFNFLYFESYEKTYFNSWI